MGDQAETTETSGDQGSADRQAEWRERLSKRLTYLLRYGAAKEGLTVHAKGYIDVRSILTLPVMRRTTEADILDLVDSSMSYRGTARFERKEDHGTTYIRARHRQQMERNPYHEGSKVTRLLESCISAICRNINDYDFEGFPDLFLLNSIIHRLKRDKALTTKTLKTVLVPSIEQLNLQGVYLTAASLRLVSTQCPNLRVLNLHDCGYILNDHYMEQMFKKLTKLESLNLSACQHLTDRTLNSLSKNNHGLLNFVGSGNRNYTEKAILKLVTSCCNLEHLDIYDNPNVSESGRQRLVEIGGERKLTVILKDLTDKTVAPDDAGMVPCVWTVTHT